jgi:epoxide hydrolase 4
MQNTTASRWSHHTTRVGDVDFHFVEAGSGPLVLLLHGFPEFWYSWRHQLPVLAAAGFRVIAPDLPGYNESSRPLAVRRYRLRSIVDDVRGLIETLGGAPACIVGHDWGGVIAWRLAALNPHLVKKLVVLNAPQPAAYLRELKRNPGQWLRSSYATFFQLPWLPEMVLRAGNFALIERGLRTQPIRPGAFSKCDITKYKLALSRTGGLSGPLNYYRAAARWPGDLYNEPQIVTAPSLLLWGERDPFLSVRLTENLTNWVPNLRIRKLQNASHWLQNDAPDEVTQALIDFCSNGQQE